MNITLNNNQLGSSMLCFDGIPNILTISEDGYGQSAEIVITLQSGLYSQTTGNSQWQVTVLGSTFENVTSAANSLGKHFYVAPNANATAAYLAKAMRTSTKLSSDWNIFATNNEVHLQARTLGNKGLNSYTTVQSNISSTYFSSTFVDGSSTSTLPYSDIEVQFFDGNEYLTTMTKKAYGDSCSFDISGILSSVAEYGDIKPYTLKISQLTKDGAYTNHGITSAFVTKGYKVNDSANYLYTSNVQMLLNSESGNRTIELYTYDTRLNFSILKGTNVGSFNIKYTVKASDESVITSETVTYTSTNAAPKIVDVAWTFAVNPLSKYVDVEVGVSRVVRFIIIKPLNGAEYAKRIFWRNELGGVSFFDFTGGAKQTYSPSISTYEKNTFDYYTAPAFELTKIYNNEGNKDMSLTSHLMKENGTYHFESLLKSGRVWTYDNGKLKYIIPKSLQINEQADYNGIYTATFSYTYSFN